MGMLFYSHPVKQKEHLDVPMDETIDRKSPILMLFSTAKKWHEMEQSGVRKDEDWHLFQKEVDSERRPIKALVLYVHQVEEGPSASQS